MRQSRHFRLDIGPGVRISQGHFHRGLGLRIDYVLASADLEVTGYEMLRPYRKGTKPSDHAPVLVELRAG